MKKINKENPITFFRKANESRQAVVKKSLKKAQDGIETNNDLINKAGSMGGYKKPSNPLTPYAGEASRNAMKEVSRNARNNVDIVNQGVNARSASVITPSADRQRAVYLEPPMRERAMINSIYSRPSQPSNTVKGVVAGEQVEYTPEQLKAMGIQKRGGAVKTKKRK